MCMLPVLQALKTQMVYPDLKRYANLGSNPPGFNKVVVLSSSDDLTPSIGVHAFLYISRRPGYKVNDFS
jgi:hypothetical protein